MEEMKRNFETNLIWTYKYDQCSVAYMRSQQSGQILNITSIAGYMGLPFRGVYSASKGALELITESYRMELKSFNITMSNIAPGDFATNIAAGRYHAPILEDSPYKVPYGTTLNMMDSHVDSGKNPLLMAEVVHKIITSKNPKIHYKVGAFLQKFSVVLKRILPDLWYEKLLSRFYNI